MEVYKYKNKAKYIFIEETGFYTEYFELEKLKTKLKYDYFDLDEKSDKKRFKKLEARLEKYCEIYEVPLEVQEKRNNIIANFNLGEKYYFIEKNKKDILKSNLMPFSMIENEYGIFTLEHMSNEQELLTLNTFIEEGTLPSEKEERPPKWVLSTMKLYLDIALILGYELYSLEEIVSLYHSKPIKKDDFLDGEIYRLKDKNKYIKLVPRLDLNCLQYTTYIVSYSNEIISKERVYKTEDLESLLNRFNNKEKFEPISETDFFKFKNRVEIKKFEIPQKVSVDLKRLPLEAPDVLDVDKFFNSLIEENKYYFFANTQAKNPMDWKVAFIVASDLEEDMYLYTKPFTLKDFNSVVKEIEAEELKYSYDKEDFIKKYKRYFKKEGLEKISTEIIFQELSGKTMLELNTQKRTHFFVKSEKDGFVYDVYENYACVRTDTYSKFYWQFFKDENEKMSWLSKHHTKEKELFSDELNFIEQYTNKYIQESNMDIIKLKKAYVKEPLLSSYFSSATYEKFSKASVVTEKDLHIKGDYKIEKKRVNGLQITLFEGDLVVDGTLFFSENSGSYFIIKGDLKAKNLIVDWNFEFIFVEGSIEVENIAVPHYRLYGENAKTNILLHEHKEAIEIKTIFDYTYEVSVYSKAITNKNIVRKDILGLFTWNKEKIYKLLCQNKSFLAPKIENSKTDLDKYYQHRFESRMLDWGYFYPEYAGCEDLEIHEDNEIRGNDIYPGTGDWVVNDIRGKSGTYGISHEDYSIYKIRVKNPEKFDIDYKQKPLKLIVDAKMLMERYIDISMLYMNWAHRDTVTFTSEDKSKRDKRYLKEKEAFVEDPYLALYWINYFGATLDKRYDEVLQIIEENDLVEKLPILKEPLAFFKQTDAFYNLHITDKDKELFLKRRAYLVYWEHSYKNYNPDNLELWWKSITIYPKLEENLIVRMRWLKNNLEKCNNWSDFDALIKKEDKKIPLLSYIFACNPNTPKREKTKYADKLVEELDKNRDYWKSEHKKKFVAGLLGDIREYVSNKERLEEFSKYF
jgi:hypothetical protein